MRKILFLLLLAVAACGEVWSAKLIENYYPATCFAEISNTDYQGEITSKGCKVIIRTIGTTTVRRYVRGQKLVYETPESPTVELEINFSNYWGHKINHLDKAQMDVSLIGEWATDAGEQMAQVTDVDVLNGIYPDAGTKNKGLTAGNRTSSYDLGAATAVFALSKNNIVDKIVDCGSVLTENNVPRMGRWMVLPTHLINLLKKSEIKDANQMGDGVSVTRNGRVGMIDTFTIYESNNFTGVADTDAGVTVDAYHIPFGISKATAFAAQMTDVQTLPNPDEPGDLVRGWNLYGFKVIKGQALGDLYAYKA